MDKKENFCGRDGCRNGDFAAALGGAFLAMLFKATSSSLPGDGPGAIGGDACVSCTPEQVGAVPGVRILPFSPVQSGLTVPQIWDQAPFPCPHLAPY